MPLPSALAAKLAKRGLYAPAAPKIEKECKRDFNGVTGCPNKSNVYHECTHWCETHWKPSNVADTKYKRNVAKLLGKYPLPHGWIDVFDKGLKRYYYWHMETDAVSWLPPDHPKAILTISAAKIREKYTKEEVNEDRVVYKMDEEVKMDKKRSKGTKLDKDTSSSAKHNKHADKEYTRKRGRHEKLDPMDPAAYSDIPIGTWSDGLESYKSSADSTASGALYQQRPYPTPTRSIKPKKKSKPKRNVSFGGTSYSS